MNTIILWVIIGIVLLATFILLLYRMIFLKENTVLSSEILNNEEMELFMDHLLKNGIAVEYNSTEDKNSPLCYYNEELGDRETIEIEAH